MAVPLLTVVAFCLLTTTEFGVIEDTKSFGVEDIATVFSCSCNWALCLINLPLSADTALAVNSKDVSVVIDRTIPTDVPDGGIRTSPSFISWVNLVLTPVTVASLVAKEFTLPDNTNWLSVVIVSAVNAAEAPVLPAWNRLLTLSVE